MLHELFPFRGEIIVHIPENRDAQNVSRDVLQQLSYVVPRLDTGGGTERHCVMERNVWDPLQQVGHTYTCTCNIIKR